MNHNQQRIDEFCGEYKKLCKKYKMISRGVTQRTLNGEWSQVEIRDVLALELADDNEAGNIKTRSIFGWPRPTQEMEDDCCLVFDDTADDIDSKPHHVITRTQ